MLKRMWNRFSTYWKDDSKGSVIMYDMTITEKVVYWFFGILLSLVSIGVLAVVIATVPIWSIPYLVWKNKKLKKEEGK